jgi:YD repeat-containing protein
VDQPHGVGLMFGYDALGRRNVAEDTLGGEERSVYDAAGRVRTETRYRDAAGAQAVGTATYTYDADGRLTGLVQTGGRRSRSTGTRTTRPGSSRRRRTTG